MLPLPQKLELVWQSAKKAREESWPEYFTRRKRIYFDKTPKRRYLDRGQDIEGACFGARADGLVGYVPSRVFYCVAYERSVSSLKEFQLLQALLNNGFNLLLFGPDGHPLRMEPGAASEAYMDGSLQFGHERVLVSMLRQEQPWLAMAPCWK